MFSVIRQFSPYPKPKQSFSDGWKWGNSAKRAVADRFAALAGATATVEVASEEALESPGCLALSTPVTSAASGSDFFLNSGLLADAELAEFSLVKSADFLNDGLVAAEVDDAFESAVEGEADSLATPVDALPAAEGVVLLPPPEVVTEVVTSGGIEIIAELVLLGFSVGI